MFDTIIYNLLQNAIKYNYNDEVQIEISHSLNEEENYWQINFMDNGLGIDDEDKVNIFNRMERACTDNNIHGSGLGLTLVKIIVEGWGGKIWVEDRVVGDRTNVSNFDVLFNKS